jgi:hypothetical protein
MSPPWTPLPGLPYPSFLQAATRTTPRGDGELKDGIGRT